MSQHAARVEGTLASNRRCLQQSFGVGGACACACFADGSRVGVVVFRRQCAVARPNPLDRVRLSASRAGRACDKPGPRLTGTERGTRKAEFAGSHVLVPRSGGGGAVRRAAASVWPTDLLTYSRVLCLRLFRPSCPVPLATTQKRDRGINRLPHLRR